MSTILAGGKKVETGDILSPPNVGVHQNGY